MDVIKFYTEMRRMCEANPECKGCPINNLGLSCGRYSEDFIKDVGTAVNAIEKWSKEHPIITNLQKFEEIFGTGIRVVEAPGSWWCAEYKPPKKGEA